MAIAMGAASQLFFVPALSAMRIFRGLARSAHRHLRRGCYEPACRPSCRELSPPQILENLLRYSCNSTRRSMSQKSNTQIVRLGAIVNGHLIDGTVSFSPAPEPGVLSELAKFEARRILAHMVEEEIAAGRL